MNDVCDAVIAEFVFGPMHCREPAVRSFSDGYDTFHTCAEHDPERKTP